MAIQGTLDNVNGPAHGLLALTDAIKCRIQLDDDKNSFAIVCDDARRSIDLLSPDLPLVKWNLRDFAFALHFG